MDRQYLRQNLLEYFGSLVQKAPSQLAFPSFMSIMFAFRGMKKTALYLQKKQQSIMDMFVCSAWESLTKVKQENSFLSCTEFCMEQEHYRMH